MHRRLRPYKLTIFVLMLLFGAAACGEADGVDGALPRSPDEPEASSTAEDAPDADLDPARILEEYSACMRSHGVELPDLTSGPGGVEGQIVEDSEAYTLADQACSPILDDLRRQFDLDRDLQAEIADQQLAFAQCMRDEGISAFPDPQPGVGLSVEELGVDQATFDAAFQACGEAVFGGGLAGTPGQTP